MFIACLFLIFGLLNQSWLVVAASLLVILARMGVGR